jgi:nucleoside-diphosphate-sugar epimerase
VTGAAGFVGRAVCQHLEHHGFAVRRAVRHAVPGLAGAWAGEIGPHTEWGPVLNGIDLVVHLAARVHVARETGPEPMAEYRRVNVEGTRRLAEAAAAAGVRRFIYLSSVKVHGEGAPKKYTEADLPGPEDDYGLSKWEAEQALREVGARTGMEWTVLRPPLVYGPGVGANFLRLMRAVAHRRPLPLGAVRNARSLVFVGNLVDALRLCLTHPGAANATFLVRDGEDLSTPELARRIARALGVAPVLFPVPVGWLRTLARLLGREHAIRRLVDSLQVDDALIRRRLAWHPPYEVDHGLRETAYWYGTLGSAPAQSVV